MSFWIFSSPRHWINISNRLCLQRTSTNDSPQNSNILEDPGKGLLVSSTEALLKEEITRYNGSVLAEVDQLLEKAVDDVAIQME